MHATIPLSIATLLAVGIIIIGSLYIASTEKMTGNFGLKLPSPDAATRAWLRLRNPASLISTAKQSSCPGREPRNGHDGDRHRDNGDNRLASFRH